MGKKLQIKIDSLDLGQILDGLRSRQESWKNTAVFLGDGFFPDDGLYARNAATQMKRKGLLTIISALSEVSSDSSTLKEIRSPQ